MLSKVFVKRIDSEGFQIVSILNGKVYVGILSIEEFEEVYRQESYWLCSGYSCYRVE